MSDPVKNNYCTEMCSGSEAGSYLRLVDFVYHSTLGSRVINKKKKKKDRVVQPARLLRLCSTPLISVD